MRTKLFLFFLSICICDIVHSQDCESLLEKYRKENNSLALSVNDLDLSNSKLVRQLKSKQDSIIYLNQRIIKLEREVADLKIELVSYKNELSSRNIKIGELNERIRKLKEDIEKKQIYTDQELALMKANLRASEDNLVSVTGELKALKNRSDTLLKVISDKTENLKLNDKVLADYSSKSRDYIHFKEREVRFEDKLYKYDEVIFRLSFNRGDTVYKPTKEEKQKIERIVELVSRYDSKAKIQMIIGSKEDAKEFREKREIAVKKVFFSFDPPFDINDSNFSKKFKDANDNYDVAILIVKK